MLWFQTEEWLEKLGADDTRSDWNEWGAGQHFNTLQKKLPRELQDRTRTGSLSIGEIEGAEGRHCWVSPIEGHRKILGSRNQVKLFDKDGTIFFDGLWSETTPEMILERKEFFIWLAPRPEANQAKASAKDKLIGAYRLIKHKLKN